MEYSNEENISVLHTDHDSNSNVSAANENIDNQEMISENIRSSSVNLSSEINSSNVTTQSSGIEINSDVIDADQEVSDTKSSTKECETDGNDICGVVKQADLVSEAIVSNVQITEKYREYISVSQEGQGGQSTEYISEYVVENNAENVYVSEVRDDNLNSSEQLHSRAVLDDSCANISDEVNQQNISNPTESEDAEMNETNSILECPKNLAENENWSDIPETNSNQLNEQTVKHEHETSGDNRDEMDHQNVDENINDVPLQEDNIVENVVQDAQNISGDQCSYNVKEEFSSVPVNESEMILNDNQRGNSEHTSESIIQEQEICSNDDNVENVEMANTSAVSSENLSAEDYAIPEGMEVTEIQEGEYTIVEGPSSLDITTNQLEEPMNTEETWVLVENNDNPEENPAGEQNEVYMDELRSEAESRQSMSSQSSEPKRRRGRKPTYDIPMHVLGHDISKPVESVPNGRAVPKPRLGVKVPYRNLTSQIVSKADIEKEVMERVRLKQEQANSRADILFARKLTQRLARKIAPSPDPPRRPTDPKKSKESHKQVQQRKETESSFNEGSETSTNQSADNSKIHNDSDLLAILEGEGDEMPVLPKEVPQPQLDDSNLKLLEREIALQQLQELPNQAPKHRIYRGRQIKSDTKAPVLTAETLVSSKNKALEKRETIQNSATAQIDEPILSEKENQTTKRSSRDVKSASPKRDLNSAETHSPKKQPVEIEPQVKVNMVLKTYSRKRKTIELPETPDESPLQKKAMLTDAENKADKSDTLTPTNVYVTKSSRIIKKKVIWDPDDEAPTRSPKSIIKPDTQPPKVTAVKTVKPVEKSPIPEKNLNEKLVKEKVAEKKNIEKIPHKKPVVPPSEKKVIVSKSESLKNKTPIKVKKLRSEVDKLLMDEGAVKMLYDLKNNDELVPKKKKDVYSVEKAHKEIMKKANEIKSDLQQNTSSESPKSLRKKDAFTPSPVKPAQITYSTERKMSKDSTRSSVHTPPGSPAYSFSHSQNSMLVRRRSSSSISSSDEVDENDGSKTSRKKSGTASSESSKSKKIKKSEQNEELQVPPQEKETSVKLVPVENKTNTFKYFTVKKTMKHIAIDINYGNEECYYTAQVLDELTNALKKFAKEKDCHVVSITSNSKTFCLGLDYTSLISDNDDTRKEIATELAERVREFLQCLLKFPKVLIAGIRGDCAGLGITMLPLFDMVIASDTATFSTSYASLGCVAEAGYLLSPPIFNNHGLAAELLYTAQKITADDAFRRGLITRLCWPEKYNETFKNIVTSVSKGSKQSLMATKKQLRRHLIQTTEATIISESKMLIEHWTSSECQKNFAQINEK